jgi:hypothetical protein
LYCLPITLGKHVCLIIFNSHGVEDPKCNPIGIYYDGGIRYYMWNNLRWCSIDIDVDDIIKRAIKLSESNAIKQKDLDFLAEFAMITNSRMGLIKAAAIKLA